ncbi:MAG: hypothetical protein ACHQF0_06025 [Chitinophagales bacterium]
MKKIIFCLFIIITLISKNSSSQTTVNEPEFAGEAVVLKKDSSTQILEKQTVQTKTKAGAGLYLTGLGKVKTKITVEGCCSSLRLKNNEALTFIVRAVDNVTDPLAVITIFRFESSKKERKAEIASVGTFSGASQNNLDMVSFKAKKFGTSSYLLKIEPQKAGEYGIIVKNPNNLNQTNTVVACFGVD